MKQKIFALMLALLMVFAQAAPSYAKGISSSKSFSSSRTSSFKGYSGSSSSKSSSFGSSSSSKSSGTTSSGSSSSSKSSGTTSSGSSSSSKSSGSSSTSGSSSYSGSSSSSRSPFGSSSSSSGSTSSGSASSSSKSSLGGATSSGSSYSGSSTSKSSSGSTGGSASVGGSSTGSSATGSSTKSTQASSQKTAYMENTYKNEMSKNNYNTYKQNLNTEQQKAYDTSYNNSYRFNNRMDFDDMLRTRPQRISMYDSMTPRIRINNYYFGGPLSYGSAFVGPWDLWFLMRASDLFWFHHWHDLYPYRDYFHAEDFEARRLRVEEMERQNMARDTSYVDPDIDYDLQFSPDYQQKHLNELYYTNRHPVGNPAGTLFGIVFIAVGLILIIKFTSRPRRRNNTRGSIY